MSSLDRPSCQDALFFLWWSKQQYLFPVWQRASWMAMDREACGNFPSMCIVFFMCLFSMIYIYMCVCYEGTCNLKSVIMNSWTINSTGRKFARSYLATSESSFVLVDPSFQLAHKNFHKKRKTCPQESVLLLGCMVDTVIQGNKTDQMLSVGDIDEVQFLVTQIKCWLCFFWLLTWGVH